ncbi:hypothetical protein [Methylobacterium brachiatum]|uniref:hypothetical protein n=1 Tax=Methylobacterium brachiatum TaxID=269660 RepID=UPI0008E2BBE8|nr:hypothetical protein [Methylobacterium brachiatum]SFI85307.1 hypothetical protein SAMN02799642_02915 [Methylobacterium brachiatum]
MPNGHAEPWREIFAGVGRRAVFFVAHGLELLVFVAVVQGVEWGLHFIAHGHEPIFFDRLPLHYLTHGADIALLLMFFVKGLLHFWKL